VPNSSDRGANEDGSAGPAAIDALRERLGQVHDLGRAASVLAWDERTMMPRAGAEARAQVMATLARVRHQMFSSDEVGELIDAARPEASGKPHDSVEAALLRVVSRDYEKARRVPAELRAEMAHASAIGDHAWIEARRRSDFKLMLPHLELNVELARRFAACYEGFEGFDHPYDPLLDEYEPGMATGEIERALGELRDGLIPLVEELRAHPPGDDSCLHGDFPADEQRALVSELLAELPLPEDGWRLDPTEHPFASGIALADIRLTTRYDPEYLGMALFSSLHEAGHGLYEAGVDPELARTPLGKPRSLGLHESQSRLWENWVGRGRPYLKHIMPRLRRAFPGRFKGVRLDQLQAAANRAEPTLIRVEADELTYNLHILIRFELELEVFGGELEPRDLPGAWNERYRSYLGLEVPDDANGVLQDVHWADGAFGYFPTYSLGNVIAGQLWEAARRDLPELDQSIAAGDLGVLGGWLREHVHRYGRRLSVAEVLDRAGCGSLSVEPLLDHLRQRVGALAQ
jgi:carboxypeptidase Taq